MRLIRRAVYRLGFRPRPWSILYSPSLSFVYTMKGWEKEVCEYMDATRPDFPDVLTDGQG